MQLLLTRKLLLSYWASAAITASTTTTRTSPSSTSCSTLLSPFSKDDGIRSSATGNRTPSLMVAREGDNENWQTKLWADSIRRDTRSYLQGNSVVDATSSDSNNSNTATVVAEVTAAALIRLAFHDAITGDANASIRYELDWSENRALSKPLALVQSIYDKNSSSNHEAASNGGGRSLADAIALVAAQAVECTGGPHIPIRLGRNDSPRADAYHLKTPIYKKGVVQKQANTVTKTMPDAGHNADGLRLYFHRLGLTEAEWVALCGIHGMGRHVSLLGMDKACLKNLTRSCLEDAPVLLPFVASSTNRFSNDYFRALLKWNVRQVEMGDVAFIPTDVALVVDPGLQRQVQKFAQSDKLYAQTFARAFQKLLETTTSGSATTTLTRERY